MHSDGALYRHPSVGWEPPAECLQLRSTFDIDPRFAEVQRGKDLLFTLVRDQVETPLANRETLEQLAEYLAQQIERFKADADFAAPRSTAWSETQQVVDTLYEIRDDFVATLLNQTKAWPKPAKTDDQSLRRLLRVIRLSDD